MMVISDLPVLSVIVEISDNWFVVVKRKINRVTPKSFKVQGG